MSQTLRIFGPNLKRNNRGDIHVHAANCGDCNHYGPGRRFGGDDDGWEIVAGTIAGVVMEVYPPDDFGYDESEWENYDDLYFAPCVTLR